MMCCPGKEQLRDKDNRIPGEAFTLSGSGVLRSESDNRCCTTSERRAG
jgi:hypothetical protein